MYISTYILIFKSQFQQFYNFLMWKKYTDISLIAWLLLFVGFYFYMRGGYELSNEVLYVSLCYLSPEKIITTWLFPSNYNSISLIFHMFDQIMNADKNVLNKKINYWYNSLPFYHSEKSPVPRGLRMHFCHPWSICDNFY